MITVGFNGDGLIQETEQTGGIRVISGRATSAGGSSANATPEQKAADQQKQVADTKQEFARMALGMFGASVAAAGPRTSDISSTSTSPDRTSRTTTTTSGTAAS